MDAASLQEAVLTAREAHSALETLKTIVDGATNSVREAELGAVGLAARPHRRRNEPIQALRSVAQALRSSSFEAALEEARFKTEAAVAHLVAAEQES